MTHWSLEEATSTDPFEPPRQLLSPGVRASVLVRVGAVLALLSEIVLPVLREALVWDGLVTAEGTRWSGAVVVVGMVAAIGLLASPSPRWVRTVFLAVGACVLVVVLGSYLGRLQDRFVDPLTRAALLGVEVSEGAAAALALWGLGRRGAAGMAVLAVAGTVGFTLAVVSGASAGVQLVALGLGAGWLVSRLLRYVALLRLLT